MTDVNIHRLSRATLPIDYCLTLKPDFEQWTFVGSETVKIAVSCPSTEVVLNALDLVITEARFNDEKGIVKYDKEMGRAILSFPNAIQPGEGNLYLEFTGVLNDEMKGFYRSTYNDDNGKQIKMAVTQFEASDARRAFPCWDEPNIKASFNVTLIVPKHMVALSNMPEISRCDVSNDLVKVDFERTPIMSTYVLAFVIGELDFVESQDSNNVKVRVYTAKNKSNRGKFALDVCCRTLPFYATYFCIAYPLPKMDLVAIPDFAAGAMENWGLVTYRETMLLVDEQESSAMSKQIVALVVGHECAHMWFGNLVTMDWWTDLWLNEGFATWIEYLCVDYCYPEFDIWTNFASDEYSRALSLDSLKSSHPIQVTVHKPSEIEEIFDAISYSKGACVIRMLNDFLGNETFKSGLSIYLNRHKYSNAVTSDLWQSLSEAANGKPVAEIMDTWTKQTGFPVVSVESVQDGNGNTIAVNLRQKRFLAHNSESCSNNQYWLVPVSICSLADPNNVLMKVVMKQNGESQLFTLPSPIHGPVRINPGAIGFYHVQYQDTVLPSLISALSQGKFGPRDRLCLAMDTFALARAGSVPTTNALDLARGYKDETNFTVWSALLGDIKVITSLVDEMDATLTPNVNRFLSHLVEPIFKTLGWEPKPDESHNDRMLRPLIIRTLGKAGHRDVVAEATKRFDCHHQAAATGDGNTGALLLADIRSCVYATVLKHGNENNVEKMMELLKKTDLHEERMRIMGSLGAVPPQLIPRIYEFALSEEVRKQDKYRVLLSTVSSSESRSMFWDFITKNWAEFRRHISNNHMQGMVIKAAFEDFVTMERHSEVEKFFNDNPIDMKRNVEQTLENININVSHLARDSEHLRFFFSQY